MSTSKPVQRRFFMAFFLAFLYFIGDSFFLGLASGFLTLIRGGFNEQEAIRLLMSLPWPLFTVHVAWVLFFILLLRGLKFHFFDVPFHFHFAWVRKVLLYTIGLVIVSILLSLLASKFYGSEAEPENQQMIMQMVKESSLLKNFLYICVIGPFIEEIIFRGLLMRYAFLNSWLGLMVSSALFATAHGPSIWIQFLIYFTIGLALGLAYKKTSQLQTSMAMHMLYNSVSFLLM